MKTIERYSTGTYNNQFGDADFKSRTLLDLLKGFPEIATSFKTYADVGCGDGTVFVSILQKLPRLGCHLEEAVGYDISPPSVKSIDLPPGSQIVQADFLSCSLCYDLVTLIDVIEHVLEPQEYLRAVAKRSRFVLLHIPLDDRLSVTLTQQWNYRLQDVGHLSFLESCKCNHDAHFSGTGTIRLPPHSWVSCTVRPSTSQSKNHASSSLAGLAAQSWIRGGNDWRSQPSGALPFAGASPEKRFCEYLNAL